MKTLISFLFLLFVSANLSAQNFSFGVETGLLSSTQTSKSISDLRNSRNTYYSGINANVHFDQRISASTGVHYLRQGFQSPTPDCYRYDDEVNPKMTAKMDYLIVPLTLNFHFGKTGKFLATVGGYGGYNLKAVQDYPEPDGGCEIYIIHDLSGFTRSYSFGGIAGAGYKIFENDKFQLTPMIRYYQGFTNTVPKMEFIQWVRKFNSASLTLTLNYKI